jgi:hypothetical protein
LTACRGDRHMLFRLQSNGGTCQLSISETSSHKEINHLTQREVTRYADVTNVTRGHKTTPFSFRVIRGLIFWTLRALMALAAHLTAMAQCVFAGTAGDIGLANSRVSVPFCRAACVSAITEFRHWLLAPLQRMGRVVRPCHSSATKARTSGLAS